MKDKDEAIAAKEKIISEKSNIVISLESEVASLLVSFSFLTSSGNIILAYDVILQVMKCFCCNYL